jgi:hypothetical protein
LLEIDMIEFSGIEFRHVDNRVMSLRLVQLGLSGAAIFKSSGEVLQPSEVLHKRPNVYPLRDPATGELQTLENLKMPDELRNLYRHLVDRGRIKQLDNFDESVLHIFSRDVLNRIKRHDGSWEEMVPAEVAEVIKRRRFFGYRESETHTPNPAPARTIVGSRS